MQCVWVKEYLRCNLHNAYLKIFYVKIVEIILKLNMREKESYWYWKTTIQFIFFQMIFITAHVNIMNKIRTHFQKVEYEQKLLTIFLFLIYFIYVLLLHLHKRFILSQYFLGTDSFIESLLQNDRILECIKIMCIAKHKCPICTLFLFYFQ